MTLEEAFKNYLVEVLRAELESNVMRRMKAMIEDEVAEQLNANDRDETTTVQRLIENAELKRFIMNVVDGHDFETRVRDVVRDNLRINVSVDADYDI